MPRYVSYILPFFVDPPRTAYDSRHILLSSLCPDCTPFVPDTVGMTAKRADWDVFGGLMS